MIHTLFYSWQSDISVKDNKNYIETCLRKALRKLKREISVELNIDRATDKKIGTIDISNSIFTKINTANIFVADITIINGKTRKYKKTPNPNVLIELGYAARTIGWENIICVLNTKYGLPELLPFDIRNRRILLYNSDDDKKKLSDSLYLAISNTHNMNTPFSVIRDYYNAPIYTHLFQIVSDFGKIFNGYNSDITTHLVSTVLNMKKPNITNYLNFNSLIGFQLFKDYSVIVNQLTIQLEKILVLKQYDDSYYIPLINIIHTLQLYDKELNRRGDLKKLVYISDSEKFILVKGNDSHTPNRYMLLKKIECSPNVGQVCDFGDFIRKDHQKALLHCFKLTPIAVQFYSGFIYEMLKHINKWIDNNGGEFILDETQLEYNQSLLSKSKQSSTKI